jgi:hypothetical protein
VSRPDERYLVETDHGPVLVIVRGDRPGLDPSLLDVRPAAEGVDIPFSTPLRAFSAKMVDILAVRGAGGLPLSPAMLSMMIREKAAEDLARIERAAAMLPREG